MKLGEADTPPVAKADPEQLALRVPPRRVMRLSRRTLAMLAGALGAVVLGATMWALPTKRRAEVSSAELFNVDRVARAEDLERLPGDYAQIAHAAKTPLPPLLGEPLPGDLGPAIVRSRQPVEARVQGEGADPQEAEQMTAAQSSVFFRLSGAQGTGRAPRNAQGSEGAGASPMQAQGPATAQGPTWAALQEANSRAFSALAAMPGHAPDRDADSASLQKRQLHKEGFLDGTGEGASRVAASVQLPASPYQVMAGTIIPAALVTGINSDLPGQVIASVTEAVYDTATGRHLLIPQGSRLIGRYDSQVAFGQRRVLLVWTRLILPDTSSVTLDRLPGIDPAGHGGLEDGVDWHWDRLMAAAALSTLLGVGAELAAPRSELDRDGSRIIVAARDGAQDAANQVGQDVVRRNLSIQPTLTIRPGTQLRVMVSKDLTLRPYQPLFFRKGQVP